jgi:hypothetical protein
MNIQLTAAGFIFSFYFIGHETSQIKVACEDRDLGLSARLYFN